MCFNCPDMIEMCWESECGRQVGMYKKARRFYVGDEYCRHLQEEYGHRFAEWKDRYDDDVL